MQMHLALLVSSTHQAEGFIRMPSVIGGKGYLRYRLLITQVPGHDTPRPGKTYTLQIFRATYPDKQEGHGWGEPCYATQPHTTLSFDGRIALDEFLAAYAISSEDGWEPVEDEEGKTDET